MKKQCLKKTVEAVLAILLILSLVSCGKTGQSRADGTGESIKDRIAAVDGVLSIEAVENNKSEWLPERYVVMVEQQIDWNDPDAGTFPQRVIVGIHPGAKVNILETNGYMIREDELTADKQPELCLLLNANHIRVEHRFSGESFPEGMNNDSTEGWEYLTTDNESADYRNGA